MPPAVNPLLTIRKYLYIIIRGEAMKEKIKFYIPRILFGLYCVLMLWLLFGQRIAWVDYSNYTNSIIKNINLIPFRTITEYLTAESNDYEHAFINLAGNVVMFIPLGFFISFIWKRLRNFGLHTLHTIIIILIIEALQLFTLLGSFDTDDLILNTVGSAIGYFIWKILQDSKSHTIK